jgi:hypothetical protein
MAPPARPLARYPTLVQSLDQLPSLVCSDSSKMDSTLELNHLHPPMSLSTEMAILNDEPVDRSPMPMAMSWVSSIRDNSTA